MISQEGFWKPLASIDSGTGKNLMKYRHSPIFQIKSTPGFKNFGVCNFYFFFQKCAGASSSFLSRALFRLYVPLYLSLKKAFHNTHPFLPVHSQAYQGRFLKVLGNVPE